MQESEGMHELRGRSTNVVLGGLDVNRTDPVLSLREKNPYFLFGITFCKLHAAKLLGGWSELFPCKEKFIQGMFPDSKWLKAALNY